jgi:hypothetical protein
MVQDLIVKKYCLLHQSLLRRGFPGSRFPVALRDTPFAETDKAKVESLRPIFSKM